MHIIIEDKKLIYLLFKHNIYYYQFWYINRRNERGWLQYGYQYLMILRYGNYLNNLKEI